MILVNFIHRTKLQQKLSKQIKFPEYKYLLLNIYSFHNKENEEIPLQILLT